MIKIEEDTNQESCFNKAQPNEPVFVLRGQDMVAGDVVRYWAYLAAGGQKLAFSTDDLLKNQHNPRKKEKLKEANMLADMMDAWSPRKMPD